MLNNGLNNKKILICKRCLGTYLPIIEKKNIIYEEPVLFQIFVQ